MSTAEHLQEDAQSVCHQRCMVSEWGFIVPVQNNNTFVPGDRSAVDAGDWVLLVVTVASTTPTTCCDGAL